jgi:hypothetical protein
MRKKKLGKKMGLTKWVLGVLLLGILGGGYWLSLERPAPITTVETPVQLKLEKLQ